MSPLVLQAYWELILFDLYLVRGNFRALYNKVRNYPISERPPAIETVERVNAAVDFACIWYWKESLCLQRSAATVCLLKQNGVRAHLVIGVQQAPFKAHAWVEVHGQVVNDKPYLPEIYAILERC